MVETTLETWPQDKNGNYIFHSSEDAIALGCLITNDSETQNKISLNRFKILSLIKSMKYWERPDLQRMMDLAVKAQFCRECLEEAKKK